jgi:release factor glutamine methyltransferase
MIELLKSLQPAADTSILDVGTGSGCLAITTKLELPFAAVGACDIDKQCLQTAAANAKNLQADVDFAASDLLVARHEPCDIILANLPYVPDDFHINTAASHEPKHAIFGGPDGLDLYRTMFQQTGEKPWHPRYIFTESLPSQHPALTQIAAAAGYSLQQTDDFIQLFMRS